MDPRRQLLAQMAAMKARIAPEIRILAEQATRVHMGHKPKQIENEASRLFKEAMTGDPANRQAILKALERRLGRPRD